MERKNPFNITFGVEPISIISRENEIQQIFEDFNYNQSNNTYIITGARGCGKTVLLGLVADRFQKLNDWIVIDLNPEQDLLEQIAAKLYDKGKLKRLFVKADFNFSFKGFGFSISGKEPITNISSLISQELSYLNKKGYKVLFTIDEVVSNQQVKIFVHEYQSFLREKYNVCLLMTGLYNNISQLQNQKSLTFLYRAPRLYLSNLNSVAIVNSYKNTFKTDDKNSIELAKLTNGYAYGFQLLGDILFKSNKNKLDNEVIAKYDEVLSERAYSIIYEELTDKEKDILFSACENQKNAYILSSLNISKSQLSNYKKTLSFKGIIENEREQVEFKLPRFKEYLLLKKEFE